MASTCFGILDLCHHGNQPVRLGSPAGDSWARQRGHAPPGMGPQAPPGGHGRLADAPRWGPKDPQQFERSQPGLQNRWGAEDQFAPRNRRPAWDAGARFAALWGNCLITLVLTACTVSTQHQKSYQGKSGPNDRPAGLPLVVGGTFRELQQHDLAAEINCVPMQMAALGLRTDGSITRMWALATTSLVYARGFAVYIIYINKYFASNIHISQRAASNIIRLFGWNSTGQLEMDPCAGADGPPHMPERPRPGGGKGFTGAGRGWVGPKRASQLFTASSAAQFRNVLYVW